jgi:hypothetical protein
MAHDLSLPSRAPELGQYREYNWDDAAFAVYTLSNKVLPHEVASALEKQWLEEGMESHLARPAPAPELNTLQDVMQAHIALDKGIQRRSDGGAKGDLEWWPTAFVVAVQEDWRAKPGGLLFVFVDEDQDCETDRFFFNLEDSYMMLSSLSFQDEELPRSKELYSQDPT